MTAGYREAALVCPGCRESLEPAEVNDATIDVCRACGGIWVDWFDGDLVQMVRGAPRPQGAPQAERAGSAACPRCHQGLRGERYLESRAEVMRCGDCAGVFVPRSSVGAVAELAGAGAERAPLDGFSKVALTLQRWLGWQER